MRRSSGCALVCLSLISCKAEPGPPSLAPRSPAASSAKPIASAEPADPSATASAPASAAPVAPAAPTYDVVFVAANDVLNVRAGASPANALMVALPFDARGVPGTGDETIAGTQRWVALRTARGIGWANAAYLTPSTSTAAFGRDPRPAALLERLRGILTARGDLRPVVGPRGLYVYDFGAERHYPVDALATLLAGTTKSKWNGAACGEGCRDGTFAEIIGAPLADVLGQARARRGVNELLRGGNASAPPPAKLANYRFVSIFDPGTETNGYLDWRSFTVYFEQVAGDPKVLAIVPDVWSP